MKKINSLKYFILSLLIPFVGIIFYFSLKKKRPNIATWALRAFFINLSVIIVISLLYCFISLGLFADLFTNEYYY